MKKILYLLLPAIFLLGLTKNEVHDENLNNPIGINIDREYIQHEDFILFSSPEKDNIKKEIPSFIFQDKESDLSVLGVDNKGINSNLIPFAKGYKKHPGNSEFIMVFPSSGGSREDCPDIDGYTSDCVDDDCCPSSWIGDDTCDGDSQPAGCNLCCYDNDGGDCSASECGEDDAGDGGNDDEVGGCPDGTVDDCADLDCCPISWIGDGLCDGEDQTWGCDLSCYDNDGGDCDIDEPANVVAEYTFTYDWYCSGNPGGSSALTLFDDGSADIGGYEGYWDDDYGLYYLDEGLCPAAGEFEVDLWFAFSNYNTIYMYTLENDLGSPGNGWHDDRDYESYGTDGQSFLDGGFIEDIDHFTMDELIGEYEFTYDWYCSGYSYSAALTLFTDGTCDIAGYSGIWGFDVGPWGYSGGFCPGANIDIDVWFMFDNYYTLYAYDITEDGTYGFMDDMEYNGQYNVDGVTILSASINDVIEVGPGLNYNNIQDAIDDIVDGGEIIVHDGTYNENLLIEKDVYIHSLNGPHLTILNGNGIGSVIVMRPESQNSHIPQIELNGFTIENGAGSSMDIDYGSEEGIVTETLGGGILVYNVAPTINNCIFDNNGNNRAGLRKGGGLFASGESEDINFPVRDYICTAPPVTEPMDLSGNTFIGNDAEEGATIYVEGFHDLTTPHNMSNGNYDVLNTSDTNRDNSLSTHWANLIGSDIDTEGSSGLLSAIVSDVWIDPINGVDEGDGSEDSPFRTISHALPLIFPTSENPLIIHLNSGTYSPDSGESFPLQLHSYISIVGADQDLSIIDAMGMSRAFTVENASYVNLSHLTVTGGMTDGLYPLNHGGGIRMRLCDAITFDNITVSDNRSKFGGGISAFFSKLVIEDAVFDGNMAICEDVNFDGECDYQGDVEDPFLGGGGAVFTAGLQYPSNTTLDRVTLTNNTSDIGGAFCGLSGEYLTLNEVDIYENTVGKNGTIYLNNVENTSFDRVDVSDNTGCTAQDGSGIGGVFIQVFNYEVGLHTLNRVSITNNEGGGIYLYNQLASDGQNFAPILNNVTVSGNYGQEDWSGMILWDAHAYIVNSILWDNNGTAVRTFDATPIMNYSDIEGGWDGYGNMDWNPDFVDPENGDYSLQPTSACIDAGIADIDDDGYPDSDYVGDAPDMGAFEYAFEINVLDGDLNFDEAVNIVDILVLVNFILDYAWIPYADLNNDGALDILDILVLVDLVIEFGTD